MDGSTKEQRHPGVRVDGASRSSGHVFILEGILGLEKPQREGWEKKYLSGTRESVFIRKRRRISGDEERHGWMGMGL